MSFFMTFIPCADPVRASSTIVPAQTQNSSIAPFANNAQGVAAASTTPHYELAAANQAAVNAALQTLGATTTTPNNTRPTPATNAYTGLRVNSPELAGIINTGYDTQIASLRDLVNGLGARQQMKSVVIVSVDIHVGFLDTAITITGIKAV